jgi:hypothetical protein
MVIMILCVAAFCAELMKTELLNYSNLFLDLACYIVVRKNVCVSEFDSSHAHRAVIMILMQMLLLRIFLWLTGLGPFRYMVYNVNV